MVAYIDGHGQHKRSRERDAYSLQHLRAVFAGCELGTLQPEHVTAYIAGRREAGAQSGTINREIGLLSAAINYARSELGWSIPNPVEGRRLQEPEGRVRWLQPAEAQALLAAAAGNQRAPHLEDFIRLALHTGMRRGEMLGLEWRRVDLQAGLICLEGIHTKAGKRRSVPLNADARQAIIGRARFRAQHCPDSPWVFCKRRGRRIGSVRRSFMEACSTAGIEDFHIHDLRHTCAAWLVTAGVPLPEVRDLLGHGSITMTERYAHLAPENVREAVRRLENWSRSGHADRNDTVEGAARA
jgi:integrase